jgi:hypothetical protein
MSVTIDLKLTMQEFEKARVLAKAKPSASPVATVESLGDCCTSLPLGPTQGPLLLS